MLIAVAWPSSWILALRAGMVFASIGQAKHRIEKRLVWPPTMTLWEYYWQAFNLDLFVLLGVFLAAGAVTMIPAWILAWVTAEGIDGVTSYRFLAAARWAWLVAACAATWLLLFGYGTGIQLQRAGMIQVQSIPPLLIVFAVIAALALGLLVSYRSTRRYLLRCVELRFDSKLAAAVENARNTRFSLGSFLLCRVLAVASFGLWLECQRDDMQKISKRDAEMQAHDAWVERMRERNFEKYGWSPSEVGISWTKPRLSLQADSPQPTLDGEVLLMIVPDDRIVHLIVRSDQITDEGLRTIATFSTLRELTIESNRVTDRGIAELARLTNLKRLTLKCPQATEESLAVFRRFPARTCIAVESDQIRDDIAQQFGREHYNVSFPPRGGSGLLFKVRIMASCLPSTTSPIVRSTFPRWLLGTLRSGGN